MVHQEQAFTRSDIKAMFMAALVFFMFIGAGPARAYAVAPDSVETADTVQAAVDAADTVPQVDVIDLLLGKQLAVVALVSLLATPTSLLPIAFGLVLVDASPGRVRRRRPRGVGRVH